MKRQIKRSVHLIIISCFTLGLCFACVDEEMESISKNVPDEQLTNEENEKKSRPN